MTLSNALSLDVLAAAGAGTCAVLLAITAPLATYALVARRIGKRGKAAALVGWGGLACGYFWLSHHEPWILLGELGAGLAYFNLATLGIIALIPRVRRGEVTRGGLYTVIAFAYVVLPALAPIQTARFALLIMGWEMGLSAYSFVVEEARGAATPGRWREGLFFVVVNPCLVYTQRGRPVPPRIARGTARVAAGAAVIFAHHTLRSLSAGWLDADTTRAAIYLTSLGSFTSFYLTKIVVTYCLQSGSAGVAVGVMGLLGHEIPERYRHPWLAKSPMEFWRRWNTYVGAWLHSYVFTELGLKYVRSARPRWRAVAKARTAVLTFMICGLLHEYAVYFKSFSLQGGVVLAFTAVGLVYVVWQAMDDLAARALRGTARALWLRVLGRGVSVASLWLVACAFSWLAMPSLADEGMPQLLRSWMGF